MRAHSTLTANVLWAAAAFHWAAVAAFRIQPVSAAKDGARIPLSRSEAEEYLTEQDDGVVANDERDGERNCGV
jgi:hypothetical protein